MHKNIYTSPTHPAYLKKILCVIIFSTLLNQCLHILKNINFVAAVSIPPKIFTGASAIFHKIKLHHLVATYFIKIYFNDTSMYLWGSYQSAHSIFWNAMYELSRSLSTVLVNKKRLRRKRICFFACCYYGCIV